MTKPTLTYDWATGLSYVGGPDIGTPTKVQAPGVTEADGWRGEQYPPPQYQNFWQSAIAQNVDYIHGVLEAADTIPAVTRQLTVSALDAMQNPSAGVTSNEWQALGTRIQSLVDNAGCMIPIRLPHGSTLTLLELLVDPGAARTSPNTMVAVVTRNTPDWVTPANATSTVVALFEDDETSNLQVMSSGVISVAITSDSLFAINLAAGNTAAASPDAVHAIRYTFTDPGPRNF